MSMIYWLFYSADTRHNGTYLTVDKNKVQLFLRFSTIFLSDLRQGWLGGRGFPLRWENETAIMDYPTAIVENGGVQR